jgi:hypothetical protein
MRAVRWRGTDVDHVRQLTLQLVVLTEYRELLYEAAVAGFERPLLVERGVRLVQGRKDASAVPDDTRVIDEGALRMDVDRITFIGSRHTSTATARLINGVEEDIDRGRPTIQPTRDRPWHLLGVSPVAVFAAAAACRLTSDESRRWRSRPAKVAADLLDPQDAALPIPGDDVVLELEGLCRAGQSRARYH